jgi:hypothetical protein
MLSVTKENDDRQRVAQKIENIRKEIIATKKLLVAAVGNHDASPAEVEKYDEV